MITGLAASSLADVQSHHVSAAAAESATWHIRQRQQQQMTAATSCHVT